MSVLAGFLGSAVLLWSTAAGAAWLIDPAFELGTGYDDNVRLREQNEQDAIITTATAQAQVRNVTERSEVSAVIGAGYVMYSDVDDLDDEDLQFLRLTAHRDSDRTQLGITGSARRDLVLRRIGAILDPLDGSDDAEGGFTTDGSLDTGEVDAGAVRDQVRRMRFNVAPYLLIALNERTDVRFGLQRAQRFFDSDGERAGLRDTTTTGADVRLSRAMTQLTSVNLTTGYALLESDGGPDADTYRATVGWRHQVSPTTEMSVDVGANHVDNDLVSETSLTYRVGGTRTTPLSRLSLQAERSAIASPFGGVVEADRVSARYRQSLSERFEFNLSMYGYRSERIATGPQQDREYIDVSPELLWRMTPSWNLAAAYTFRWTDREEEPGTATSNAVSLSLRYQPPRRM